MVSELPVIGLGPHGESSASPALLSLGPADRARAQAAAFDVALVLHTTESDWAGQFVAGLATVLGHDAARLVEVVDCGFDARAQVAALERLSAHKPDAIVSLPIANVVVADAHRRVSEAGIQLVLVDNSPSSLMAGRDYVSLVSADNFALGQIGARLLAPEVAIGGRVGVLSYTADFFVAAQREIAFRKWVAAGRPDIALVSIRFTAIDGVRAAVERCLDVEPDLAGLFAVWDTPALEALAALRSRGRTMPVTTVDLGTAVATELAAGTFVRGIGAQQPFEQGATAATVTLAALLGISVSPWIVLPAIEVTRDRVVAAYQSVWHAAAPPALIALAQDDRR